MIQRQFGASVINSYGDFLRGLTAKTLDAALAKGTFDFVAEAHRLGQAHHRQHRPRLRGRAAAQRGEREVPRSALPFTRLHRGLRVRPGAGPAAAGGDGTDLVSKLVNTTPRDGIPLSAQDFDNYFLLLVVAGNETTRHTITHSMLALLQHPEQLARLKDDPSVIPTAVEEFLRWASPVYHFRRTATRDVELGGKQVKEGDRVVMWYASGNRDEEVFGNP